MKYNIRGDKITVTGAMKNYIEEKLSKMDRFFEEPRDITATVLVKVKDLERKNKDRLSRKYKNSEHVEFNFNYEDEEEKEENNSKIVKRKNISMKPMDEEEAILQIDLLNHDFFVFKNIDEECVSVLYVRKDGNYGIINMK